MRRFVVVHVEGVNGIKGRVHEFFGFSERVEASLKVGGGIVDGILELTHSLESLVNLALFVCCLEFGVRLRKKFSVGLVRRLLQLQRQLPLPLLALDHLHERGVDSNAHGVDNIFFSCRDLEIFKLQQRLLEVWKRVHDACLPLGVLGVGGVASRILNQAWQMAIFHLGRHGQ